MSGVFYSVVGGDQVVYLGNAFSLTITTIPISAAAAAAAGGGGGGARRRRFAAIILARRLGVFLIGVVHGAIRLG